MSMNEERPVGQTSDMSTEGARLRTARAFCISTHMAKKGLKQIEESSSRGKLSSEGKALHSEKGKTPNQMTVPKNH